jgi:magnesium transporter
VTTAIQVNLSMVTIEESETTKRLAAWAGIFAAATAFAGIWGMNFEIMPELKWRHGYAFVMLLMLLIATVQGWWLWRRGWFQDWTGQGCRPGTAPPAGWDSVAAATICP